MTKRGSALRRKCDFVFGAPIVFALGAARRRRPLPALIKSIGFLTCSAIGDTILSSAIARDLKTLYPKASITAFIAGSSVGLSQVIDGFDKEIVLPITSPMEALADLNRNCTDILIDVTPWPRAIPILAAISQARYTIGFRTRGQARHWAYDSAVEHSPALHEIDNYRALLGPLGVSGNLPPRARERFRYMTAVRGLDGRPMLSFHPWASGFRSSLREWPEERWAALAREAVVYGFHIAITGAPSDAARAHELAALIGYPDRVHVKAGESLAGTAQTLAQSVGVVSVNTGVMHLAAALDRPLVALHGPTNPVRWGPVGSMTKVVGPGIADGGAYLNLGYEYPSEPPDCMGMIDVEDVWQALMELVERSGGYDLQSASSLPTRLFDVETDRATV